MTLGASRSPRLPISSITQPSESTPMPTARRYRNPVKIPSSSSTSREAFPQARTRRVKGMERKNISSEARVPEHGQPAPAQHRRAAPDELRVRVQRALDLAVRDRARQQLLVHGDADLVPLPDEQVRLPRGLL